MWFYTKVRFQSGGGYPGTHLEKNAWREVPGHPLREKCLEGGTRTPLLREKCLQGVPPQRKMSAGGTPSEKNVCRGYPLREKMAGVGYQAKQLFAGSKIFAAGAPPPPPLISILKKIFFPSEWII